MSICPEFQVLCDLLGLPRYPDGEMDLLIGTVVPTTSDGLFTLIARSPYYYYPLMVMQSTLSNIARESAVDTAYTVVVYLESFKSYLLNHHYYYKLANGKTDFPTSLFEARTLGFQPQHYSFSHARYVEMVDDAIGPNFLNLLHTSWAHLGVVPHEMTTVCIARDISSTISLPTETTKELANNIPWSGLSDTGDLSVKAEMSMEGTATDISLIPVTTKDLASDTPWSEITRDTEFSATTKDLASDTPRSELTLHDTELSDLSNMVTTEEPPLIILTMMNTFDKKCNIQLREVNKDGRTYLPRSTRSKTLSHATADRPHGRLMLELYYKKFPPEFPDSYVTTFSIYTQTTTRGYITGYISRAIPTQ